MRKLLLKDLSKASTSGILTALRKMPWTDPNVVQMLFRMFSRPWRVKYSNVDLLALLLASLYTYHPEFVICVIDEVFDSVYVGIEQPAVEHNQRRVAVMRYVGDIYNYRLLRTSVIFDTLYTLLEHRKQVDSMNGVTVRIRLVCTLLETCGACFEDDSSNTDGLGKYADRLDRFLAAFELFVLAHETGLPLESVHVVHDMFRAFRPTWKMKTSYTDARTAFQNLVDANTRRDARLVVFWEFWMEYERGQATVNKAQVAEQRTTTVRKYRRSALTIPFDPIPRPRPRFHSSTRPSDTSVLNTHDDDDYLGTQTTTPISTPNSTKCSSSRLSWIKWSAEQARGLKNATLPVAWGVGALEPAFSLKTVR